MTHPDWASRFAAAIEVQLEAISVPGEVEVHSVRAPSSEEVEVVYSAPGDTQLRGIRVSAEVIRSAPTRG